MPGTVFSYSFLKLSHRQQDSKNIPPWTKRQTRLLSRRITVRQISMRNTKIISLYVLICVLSFAAFAALWYCEHKIIADPIYIFCVLVLLPAAFLISLTGLIVGLVISLKPFISERIKIYCFMLSLICGAPAIFIFASTVANSYGGKPSWAIWMRHNSIEP